MVHFPVHHRHHGVLRLVARYHGEGSSLLSTRSKGISFLPFSSALVTSYCYATVLAGRSGRGDIFDLCPMLERMPTGRQEKGIVPGAVHSSQSTSPESGQLRYRAHFLHATGGSTSSTTTLTSPVTCWSFLLPSLQRAAACGNQRQFLFEVRRRLPLLEDELAEAQLKYLVCWPRLFRDAGVCLPPRCQDCISRERRTREKKGIPSPSSVALLLLSSSASSAGTQEEGMIPTEGATRMGTSSSSTLTTSSSISRCTSTVSASAMRVQEVCEDRRLCELHAHIVDIVEEELLDENIDEESGTKGKEVQSCSTVEEGIEKTNASAISLVATPKDEKDVFSVYPASMYTTENSNRPSRREKQRNLWKKQWKENMEWHREMWCSSA